MKNLLKLFGVLDTELRSDLFSTARLKLTLYAIIAIAIYLFAFHAYFHWRHEVLLRESVSETLINPQTQQRVIDEARAHRERVEMEISLFSLLGMSIVAFFASGFVLKPIQQSMWGRKRFTADAAHDLRTPLAIMKTEVELALREKNPDPAALRAVLTSNMEEIDRMTTIIEDLLALTRYDNARYAAEMPRDAIDIRHIAEHIIDGMRSRASHKGIRLTLRRHEAGSVSGDGRAIKRMLSNILDNAISYTPAGGSVTVDVERTEKRIVIRVTDTGIGIPDKDLPHVFERFYQAEKPNNFPARKSSGLGLAIVKEIVEKHGGSVSIESAPSAGTRVLVSLPVA